MARDALARIPEPFQSYLADVVLIVEDFADDETLDALGIEDPFDLSGVYVGIFGRRKIVDAFGADFARIASTSFAARSSTNGSIAGSSSPIW